jgi:hypothetical protein
MKNASRVAQRETMTSELATLTRDPALTVRPDPAFHNRVILSPWAREAHMPYLRPFLAGLLGSAITYLCFLTWLHWKAVSLVKEQGATGLIAVTGAQVYVLHSPSFWALAIIAFGVVFFLFRNA